MLAGMILSAISVGSAGLAVSILSGHPPILALLFYSLSGCCGVLAFAWQAVQAKDGLG